jgi:hypothetical protein
MKRIKSFKGIILVVVFLFVLPKLHAQVKGKVNRNQFFSTYWQAGLRIGTPVFLGDVKRYRYVPAYDEWRASAGLSVARRLSPVFGVEAVYNLGKLAGSDKYTNQLFESRFHEFSIRTVVHLAEVAGLNENSIPFAFNLIAGAGLTMYNSTLFVRTSRTVMNESGYRKEGVLLLGLNLYIHLSSRVSLRIESVNTGMNSDWMDFKKSGFPFDVYNLTVVGLNVRFRYGAIGSSYYPKRVVRRRFHRGF